MDAQWTRCAGLIGRHVFHSSVLVPLVYDAAASTGSHPPLLGYPRQEGEFADDADAGTARTMLRTQLSIGACIFRWGRFKASLASSADFGVVRRVLWQSRS